MSKRLRLWVDINPRQIPTLFFLHNLSHTKKSGSMSDSLFFLDYRLQVAGCRLQVAGCRLAGCRLQVAGCRLADWIRTFNFPTFNFPTFNFSTFNFPTFNFPTFNFPTFNFPTFNFPTFNLQPLRLNQHPSGSRNTSPRCHGFVSQLSESAFKRTNGRENVAIADKAEVTNPENFPL
jgi:hypothetical protein